MATVPSPSPDLSIDKQFAVFGVLLPVLAALGCCFNIIGVIVYHLPRLKGRWMTYISEHFNCPR